MIISGGYILKLIQTIIAMIRPVFGHNAVKRWAKDNPDVVVTWITIFILTLTVVYLKEQATRNLYMQQPLMKKLTDTQDQNKYLAGQVQSLQNDLLDSEARTQKMLSQCQDVVLGADTAYGQQMKSLQSSKTDIPASAPNMITAN